MMDHGVTVNNFCYIRLEQCVLRSWSYRVVTPCSLTGG